MGLARELYIIFVYGGFVNRRKILLTDNTGKIRKRDNASGGDPIMALRGFIIAETFFLSLSRSLSCLHQFSVHVIHYYYYYYHHRNTLCDDHRESLALLAISRSAACFVTARACEFY